MDKIFRCKKCGREYSSYALFKNMLISCCCGGGLESIKEEPMSDCETGARIREKIVKHWIDENLHGEAGYAGTIMSWDSASSYIERLGENSHYVFADAYLTTKEIDCLHRNLSKEAFSATGLKAPEKKFEPFFFVTQTGGLRFAGDERDVKQVRDGIVVRTMSLYARHDGLPTMLKLLGVPPLDDLANQKLRKLDEWAERSEYPAILGIRGEIARLLSEPVSFKKGV